MISEARDWLMQGAEAGMRYRLLLPDDALRGSFGNQLGAAAGSSLDFKDFREYQPGDDLRRIDWGMYARSDKLTVKLFREEVNPHLDLLIDSSLSMALPDTPKAQALYGISALLAAAASNAQCTCAAWMLDDGVVQVPHGADHPALWEGLRLERTESPLEALNRMPPRWRKAGMRILVSDLLWRGDPGRFVKKFADEAAGCVLIQLVSRDDIEPPARGNTRVYDVENNEHLEIFIDATAQARYRQALESHEDTWRAACSQTGAALHRVVAEEVVNGWDLVELEAAGVLGAL